MSIQTANQLRESLEESGLVISWQTRGGYILRDKGGKTLSFWQADDRHFGYVVVIEGIGHSFVCCGRGVDHTKYPTEKGE